MKPIEQKYDQCLATVTSMLVAEGMRPATELLKTATSIIEETGYDNWNGGTTIWTIYLRISPEAYAHLGAQKEIIEKEINGRLKPVLEQVTTDWCSAVILPLIAPNPEWRETDESVSRETRQNIIDGLKIDRVSWSGRLFIRYHLTHLLQFQDLLDQPNISLSSVWLLLPYHLSATR